MGPFFAYSLFFLFSFLFLGGDANIFFYILSFSYSSSLSILCKQVLHSNQFSLYSLQTPALFLFFFFPHFSRRNLTIHFSDYCPSGFEIIRVFYIITFQGINSAPEIIHSGSINLFLFTEILCLHMTLPIMKGKTKPSVPSLSVLQQGENKFH